MPAMTSTCKVPGHLLLGSLEKSRVPVIEQQRQRREADLILDRLTRQPGVILADEVGMGKTFVALAVAYSVAIDNPTGPVVVMVPKNLIDKWCRDLDAFCELYAPERKAFCCRGGIATAELAKPHVIRYGIALNSVDYLKLLDDPKRVRCHIVFLAHGAMSRGLNDEWVRLALIRETFRRHGRKRRLSKIRKQIHRFLAELLWIKFRQNATTDKEEIWKTLLTFDPSTWKSIYNSKIRNDKNALYDDPVPQAVLTAISRLDLQAFALALESMPVRTSSDPERLKERLQHARETLRTEEETLWKHIIATTRWRSPLLIMDEAHHLKNPGTLLARQLQSKESDDDLKVGDGALSRSFDRMLFLTATPFQLGHNELVRVLRRFGDTRWDKTIFGIEVEFHQRLDQLRDALSIAQQSSIRLFNTWTQLRKQDLPTTTSTADWWQRLCGDDVDGLSQQQRFFRDTVVESRKKREKAEGLLRPWIIRNNKGDLWPGTATVRRERLDGAKILDESMPGGLDIPAEQIMPFFLAARSAAEAGKDTLGEALSSSYEAFRNTRKNRTADKDDIQAEPSQPLNHPSWYLNEFDLALERVTGQAHPKMSATVRRVVNLWEQGEKVLVFAFYRQTCRALRIHISAEMDRRIIIHARTRLERAGLPSDDHSIEKLIKDIQDRFFDTTTANERQALDRALTNIIVPFADKLSSTSISIDDIRRVMRRFLRVRTNLVRAFPIHRFNDIEPHLAVRSMLDTEDKSRVSWRAKFNAFLNFLAHECAEKERTDYIQASIRTQTRGIRVKRDEIAPDIGDEEQEDIGMTLANIQVATGSTTHEARSRLMLAFNTPFFPDVLVCSRVMGEGVDLHRHCRHVIHHDLDWNPSDIEQRTGRIDRLGCKAEGRHPISVFLPYLAGTADERQYRVMTEREKWFRIVMGQEKVAELIPESDDACRPPPPEEFQKMLVFNLGA